MSQPLRIEYLDTRYHIINRGRWSQEIFFTDQDRKWFIKVLQEAAELRNLKVVSYCLMSNYYHLLIETDSHLLEVLRYIHRNPVKAVSVKSNNDY